jgi:hypothetical protein
MNATAKLQVSLLTALWTWKFWPTLHICPHHPACANSKDERNRWNLKTPHNLAHSVTQPLSATDTLGSSVHVASRSGAHGDFGPVVALHSYADSSPVVTSDDVIENSRSRHSTRQLKVGQA